MCSSDACAVVLAVVLSCSLVSAGACDSDSEAARSAGPVGDALSADGVDANEGGDASADADGGGCTDEAQPPACWECAYDAPVGYASCGDAGWTCAQGVLELECAPTDYPTCDDYGGEVCCAEDGSTTPARCPTPSSPFCVDGSTPRKTCLCDPGWGYIAEVDRCVECGSHDDPNPYDACPEGFRWLSAVGCEDSGTSWYVCDES